MCVYSYRCCGAQWHVARLPSRVGICRVAPGSILVLRVWIATEVISAFDASIREHAVTGELVRVRRLR